MGLPAKSVIGVASVILLVVFLWKARVPLAYVQALLVDPFNLSVYRGANAALGTPVSGERRVVFIGDSITEYWDLKGSFPGLPYINRGVAAETTPQMLVRFRQDAIALSPRVVVILSGINDIGGKFGRPTLENTEDNLATMAELAKAHQIQVVLCSLLPNGRDGSRRLAERTGKVQQLNAWIRNYAAENGDVFVDYYMAMKDEHGGLPAALSDDGVHPDDAGYAIMTPLAAEGIEKALSGEPQPPANH